jgi:hypothetical protein
MLELLRYLFGNSQYSYHSCFLNECRLVLQEKGYLKNNQL